MRFITILFIECKFSVFTYKCQEIIVKIQWSHNLCFKRNYVLHNFNHWHNES